MTALGTGRVAPPRPLLCVLDGEHQDLDVADAAVDGVFTHAGTTLRLGTRPDWSGPGLPDDQEWRIEWVKLYEGLHLAHAYEVTGRPVYLRTWEDLVDSFCDQVPVGHDPSDVTARRVQNWLYAWWRMARSAHLPAPSPTLTARLVSRVLADSEHLARHLTRERNHRTLELYALLLVELSVRQDADRAAEVLDLLAQNASRDIWADGVHRECSTDYHCIVLRSLVGAVANARIAGIAVPADLLEATGRAADFALHVQRPDGLTPALSDGDVGDFRSLLALAADVLGREDLLWAATAGAAGAPPERTAVSFPVGGYHVQRSGWGQGDTPYVAERFAIMDCGPVGDGGHGHYDALSVELYAAGRPLVVDPGRYTYADGPDGWRHRFKGTAAHNTVTVDGLDQTPYRPGRPVGPTATAELVGRTTAPGLDLVRGRVTSPSYDAVHTRVLALVDDDHWVVHDRVRGRSEHRYEVRWHLPSAAWQRVVVRTGPSQVTVCAPGLALVLVGAGSVHVEDGWVSDAYGERSPAPVVVARVDARHADVVSVLVPDPDGRLGPQVRVRARTGAATCRARVTTASRSRSLWWGTRTGWARVLP